MRCVENVERTCRVQREKEQEKGSGRGEQERLYGVGKASKTLSELCLPLLKSSECQLNGGSLQDNMLPFGGILRSHLKISLDHRWIVVYNTISVALDYHRFGSW